MFTTRRGLWVSVALIASLAGGAAQAAQVVVMDESWVHAPDLADSHYRVLPMDGTPGDWVNPVNYAGGSAWVYLEVHTKPTQQETRFQVCFEATPTYACTNQSPTYTDVGTYEWETPFANFYQGDQVDWTKGTNKIACILKDTMNGKPSADNVGDEKAALYMPTEVRMVVTLVEAGSVYVPPTPTDPEGSTGGDNTGSTGGDNTGTTGGHTDDTGASHSTTSDSATSSDDTGTTGPEGTGGTGGPITTSATTGGATDPTSGGATGDSTGTTSSTGASESSDGASDDKASGCSCDASTAPGDRGALMLLGLLLGLGSRRRARR